MSRVALLMAVLVVMVVFWGCAGPKPGVVAKVGKYKVTAEELDKAMASARFKSFEEELEARKKRVESLAENKLILAAAYDAGLEKSEDLLNQMESNKKTIVLNALYKVEIEQKAGVPTDADVQVLYDRMKVLIHAKHILVKEESLANALYERLKGGANFDELAKEYSEDRSNKDKGGDLGEFTAMSMVQEFEDAAYALAVGEISKPVKTQFGWHIILLVDKRPNERIQPLEAEKTRISQSLERKRKSDLANAFVENLFTDAQIKFNDDAIKAAMEAYKEAVPKSPDQKPVVALTPEQRAMTLFTYKYGSWTLGDFDSAFQQLPPFRRMPLDNSAAIEDFGKRSIQGMLLEKKAEELGIENTEEYKSQYTEDLERRMIDEYRKSQLYKDVEPTDEVVKAYYDANPDSFMEGEQVNVIEIQVATEEEAKKLLAKVNKGGDMGKLANANTLRSYVKAKNGELGFFTQQRYPELFAAAKTLQPGQVYPNPIPFQGKFSIIKLLETKAPQIRTFDSVMRIIKNKLRSQMRQDAYQKWLDDAKKKYGFRIYDTEIEKTIDRTKYETAPAG